MNLWAPACSFKTHCMRLMLRVLWRLRCALREQNRPALPCFGSFKKQLICLGASAGFCAPARFTGCCAASQQELFFGCLGVLLQGAAGHLHCQCLWQFCVASLSECVVVKGAQVVIKYNPASRASLRGWIRTTYYVSVCMSVYSPGVAVFICCPAVGCQNLWFGRGVHGLVQLSAFLRYGNIWSLAYVEQLIP